MYLFEVYAHKNIVYFMKKRKFLYTFLYTFSAGAKKLDEMGKNCTLHGWILR